MYVCTYGSTILQLSRNTTETTYYLTKREICNIQSIFFTDMRAIRSAIGDHIFLLPWLSLSQFSLHIYTTDPRKLDFAQDPWADRGIWHCGCLALWLFGIVVSELTLIICWLLSHALSTFRRDKIFYPNNGQDV